MKRKKKKNPAAWVSAHPWMTFFIVIATVSTAGAVLGANR